MSDDRTRTTWSVDRDTVVRFGRSLAHGVLLEIGKFILIGVGAILLFNACVRFFGWGGDDTDPPGGRSGVMLRTDHRTGCQYLETSAGGITPRLDANGRHMCQ